MRRTGKADVYTRHAGLIDTAVAVMCQGEHIATLFTGQVVIEPKREEHLLQIQDSLAGLDYLDPAKLQTGYWKVREVTQEDIQHTITVLEILASHLANTWKRLIDLVRGQQQRDREARLCRREFAHMLLDGRVDLEQPRLGELARRTMNASVADWQSSRRILIEKQWSRGGTRTPRHRIGNLMFERFNRRSGFHGLLREVLILPQHAVHVVPRLGIRRHGSSELVHGIRSRIVRGDHLHHVAIVLIGEDAQIANAAAGQ